MAEKVLGLAGPGEGAWISTRNLKNPKARICGMLNASPIEVHCAENPTDDPNNCVHILEGNGIFELCYAAFMRVRYAGEDKTMVCTFFSGAQVAVHQS